MRYRLLGPVAVEGDDGSPLSIPAPKRRALLAVLLLNANRPVSVDELIAALWGEDPPPAAVASLHAHVSRLRRELARGAIETAPPGYRVCVDAGELDLAEWDRLAGVGREVLRQGRWATASELLSEGLALWRGPALADVRDVSTCYVRAAALDEERLHATEDRIEAELRLGSAAGLVGELWDLAHSNPERERLWGLLMRALYRSGRQAEALAAYRELRGHLVTELGIDPSPELQDLEGRILRQDPELAGPGGRPVASVRLPAQPSNLIGREEELTAIHGRLVGDEPLLTLVGPGGVGKTRLAIEAAHRLVAEYPDGVHFVDLSPVRDAGLVLSTIGQEIGGGERPWELILDRRMLLVLDNFEQVLEAAPGVATLVGHCPRMSVLVTSRAPLRIRREAVMEVEPLRADDASRLFEVRAREALARWQADSETVGDIVARLDGLPLAIELTAARVGALAPAALRAALERPLDVAARGPRDAPRRHQALRETIRWSYDLLSPAARRTMRGLAAFAGGCDLPAAAAVADATVDTISELVEHSLVRRQSDRYRLLDTIREFAAGEAEGAGEATGDRDRHLVHYMEVMSRVDRRGEDADERNTWLAVCHRERDNLRLAFAHAEAKADAASVRALNQGVGLYWLLVGALAEGERWARANLDAIPPSDPQRRAHAIAHLAEYPRWSGDHERAIALREEGIREARRSGDIEILATLEDDLVWSLALLGRFEDAQAAIGEAYAMRDRMPDDVHGRSHTLSADAFLRLRIGRPEEALPLVEEVKAADLVAQLPPVWAIETADLEARVLLELGRTAEAEALYSQVLADSVREDFRIGMLDAIESLAQLTAEDEPMRAALLIGLADRVRAESGLAGYDPAAFARVVDEVRSQCGPEAFDEQRMAGHSLPVRAALDA